MNFKNGFIAVAAAVLCLSALTSCRNEGTVSFGTGNIGGNYYTYGNAFAQLVSSDNEKINLNIKETAGSAANLRLIQQGFYMI